MTLTAARTHAAPQPRVELLACQTLDGLGSAQGVRCHHGFVYAFGDSDTGVVREYRLHADALRLQPTGRAVRLTQHGANLLPHPTGFAFHPTLGAFLGDTVRGRGVIWRIDWPRALADGNLDHAVINRCADDLAVNGCRPEFVRYRGRPCVATSDYGPCGNEVRLYDPLALGRVDRTSLDGVLVARFPCGPWVQSLHWLDADGLLALVQNQRAGLGYRLTFLDPQAPDAPARVVDLDHPADELEGFTLLTPGLSLLLSSSTRDNAWFARVTLPRSSPRAAA